MLFVCTGNVCRSPIAERLARARLDERLGATAGRYRLLSAGTGALVGSEMHPDSARALRDLGGDPQDFRARQVNEDVLAGVDLTLTMTRLHRRVVLERAPRGMRTTFTLLEAADLLRLVPPEAVPHDPDHVEQARMLVRRMAAARAHRRGGDADDVADPIGRPPEEHARVGQVVAAAVALLVDRLVLLDGQPDDEPGGPSAGLSGLV